MKGYSLVGPVRQRGVGLGGLLVGAALLGIVALFAMKLFPDVSEYYAILKDVKATAQDPSLQDKSVGEIRTAFSKRAEIDNIQAITPEDLVISKQDGGISISFEYSRKIPLVANASLWLDFEGSSDKK